MSYLLRVWSDQHTSGTYTDIQPHDIIDINIDDNRAANDDPFEIIGRSAKITLPNNINTELLLTLDNYQIPIAADSSISSPFGIVINYNKNFFRNLIQLIDDSTDAAIFTGLVGREGIEVDEATERISITVYDSLYIWITLAKSKKFFNSAGKLDKFHIDEYLAIPFYISSLVTNADIVGNPLAEISFDPTFITDSFVRNQILPIPEGYKRAYQYGIPDEALEIDFGASDWCVLGQYSTVWFDTARGYTVVSYITLYRSVGTASGVYRYKIKAQRTRYDYDSLLQPVTFVEFNLGLNQTLDSWEDVDNILKSLRIIDPTIGSPTSESVTVSYGIYNQHSLTTTRPVWDFETVMTVGGAVVRANDPIFGFTTADLNIYPWIIYGEFNGSDSVSSVLKSIMSLWGVGVKAKPDGGLEFYAHLMRHVGTGTPLAVTDTDVINLTSTGSFADGRKFVNSMEIFTYGTMIADGKFAYFRDFYENISTKYTVILPRKYYDDYTLLPFMPLTIMGKTMYLNQWTEPLYDDIIRLECFGKWGDN